ncbi:MAG: ABC transporter ATP-binding protein [Comamonas sp.]
MIEVKDLYFAYGNTPVLDGIFFTIRPGERIAILGANGSGKTTLAHWLAGWLTSANADGRGTVLWQGRPWQDYSIAERATAIQLVGQFPAQHLTGRAFTVAEEISFGPENLGLPAEEIITRRDQAMTTCRLEALAHRAPFTLSGGEQQRLVIAAALALSPSVLILDEPFTNLDPASRDHLAGVLTELPESVTLVFFESNPDVALATAKHFLLLRDGRIAVEGDARTVLLSAACTEVLGLPVIARAFQQLPEGHGLPDRALPLNDCEAAALLSEYKRCSV